MTRALPVVNCLNCRHCELLPHSDFSRDIVPIYCGKTGRNTPAKFERCAITNPRMRRARKATQRSRSGDRSGRWTPAALAYLCARYGTEPGVQLTARLQRNPKVIATRAAHIGLRRDPAFRLEVMRQTMQRAGTKNGSEPWTPKQIAALKRMYSSPLWPENGDRGEKSKAKWRVVLSVINALGPPRTQRAIRGRINTMPHKERFV